MFAVLLLPCKQGILTKPIARQDSSPDIAHFVSGKFYVHDLDFDMTRVWVCGWVLVEGGGGG